LSIAAFFIFGTVAKLRYVLQLCGCSGFLTDAVCGIQRNFINFAGCSAYTKA
jgi:hypothetical protein